MIFLRLNIYFNKDALIKENTKSSNVVSTCIYNFALLNGCHLHHYYSLVNFKNYRGTPAYILDPASMNSVK